MSAARSPRDLRRRSSARYSAGSFASAARSRTASRHLLHLGVRLERERIAVGLVCAVEIAARLEISNLRNTGHRLDRARPPCGSRQRGLRIALLPLEAATSGRNGLSGGSRSRSCTSSASSIFPCRANWRARAIFCSGPELQDFDAPPRRSARVGVTRSNATRVGLAVQYDQRLPWPSSAGTSLRACSNARSSAAARRSSFCASST